MTEKREYVSKIEARNGAQYADLQNIVSAVEASGYQADANPSSGSVEVYRPVMSDE